MANNCAYTMKVVARNKETIERLFQIMDYKDPEYFLYRVFNVEWMDEPYPEKDGYWTAKIYGDVAWAAASWFETCENKNDVAENGAHYVTLDILCSRLNIGVEVFTEEPGMCFQEWYRCNANGEVQKDVAEWKQYWSDEDGVELDTPIEEGGLEGYCKFSTNEEIYQM